MDFMTVKEASLLWNMDVSRIGKLLKEGRISGAEKTGGHWYIPRGTAKPMDRRTRQGIRQTEPTFFRFPLLVNKDANQFFPPLTEDEMLLHQAQADFFACEFEKALAEFKHLEEHTKSIYIRIGTLFFECCLAWGYQKGAGFKDHLYKLKKAFVSDFPYKREMELIFPWLYSFIGLFENASKCLVVDPCYQYHPSVCPLLSYLSFFHSLNGNVSPVNPDVYVILCKILEHDGFFYEAQELHIVLYIYYSSLSEKEAAFYHLRRGLDIAVEHHLMMIPACYESYYPDEYHTVLQDYPKELAEKIHACSVALHDSNARCTELFGITDMYSNISQNDYPYIMYAVQGFTYREIAKFLNLSERTVASRYGSIYEKLNIKNKRDLIRLYYNAAAGDVDIESFRTGQDGNSLRDGLR